VISAHGLRAYLVGTRPHKGIVAQISTDISCNDFAVDAILWNEILIRTAGAPAPVSVAFAVSARHGGSRRMEVESGRKEEREDLRPDVGQAQWANISRAAGRQEVIRKG
jgi:hypothetical protein